MSDSSNPVLNNEFQKIDQQSLFKTITKKVLTVDNVNQLQKKFHEAFNLAITPRCGPVHLNLPRDVLSSCIVKAIYQLGAAAGCSIYTMHIPRRSDEGSCVVDDLSKDDNIRHIVNIIGVDNILSGWRFPRPPRSLMRWLRQPFVDEWLGSDIIEDLRSAHPNLRFFGYS